MERSVYVERGRKGKVGRGEKIFLFFFSSFLELVLLLGHHTLTILLIIDIYGRERGLAKTRNESAGLALAKRLVDKETGPARRKTWSEILFQWRAIIRPCEKKKLNES